MKTEKDKCCGCGICALECPVSAITMVRDELDALYPDIDLSKCIHCKKCERVCAFSLGQEHKKQQVTYAAIAQNINPEESSSGGVAASVEVEVIRSGGVVYGSIYSQDLSTITVKHIRTASQESIGLLKGSKYVQSDLNITFRQAQQDLQNGKPVLFTGTPCQIAALNAFLKRKYDNLFTIEVVCHGVPSEGFFHAYLAEIEKRRAMQISSVSFREKRTGWGHIGEITFNNKGVMKTEQLSSGTSSYYYMFLHGISFRRCCYSCPFKGNNRQANITIGDFWGVEKFHPQIRTNKRTGVSCIIVNDNQGHKLIDKYGSGLMLVKSNYEFAIEQNPQIDRPMAVPHSRKRIIKAYRKGGYRAVENWYLLRKLIYNNILFLNMRKCLRYLQEHVHLI